MVAFRRGRRLLLVGVVCLISALSLQSPGSAATSAKAVTRATPTGAGAVYHWGVPLWHDEYETPCGFLPKCPPDATKSPPLSPDWAITDRNLVLDKWGELVIVGRPDGQEVSATLTGHPHSYGRWEVRVFAHQIKTPSHYRVVAELIPAKTAAYHCGAQNITMADYVMGSHRTRMSIRTLPDRQFSYSMRPNTGPWDWNTYGVEITRTHISWFADDKVVMTERRPAALSGTLYTLRLRLVGNGATDTTPPKMQLDWSRYFTMDRPNTQSIVAPKAHVGTYGGGC